MPRLVQVPDEVLAAVHREMESGGRAAPMIRIGISDNTWRKMRARLPIRASVAARVIERFGDRTMGERA